MMGWAARFNLNALGVSNINAYYSVACPQWNDAGTMEKLWLFPPAFAIHPVRGRCQLFRGGLACRSNAELGGDKIKGKLEKIP